MLCDAVCDVHDHQVQFLSLHFHIKLNMKTLLKSRLILFICVQILASFSFRCCNNANFLFKVAMNQLTFSLLICLLGVTEMLVSCGIHAFFTLQVISIHQHIHLSTKEIRHTETFANLAGSCQLSYEKIKTVIELLNEAQ